MIQEGLARELIRRLQDFRKTVGLEIATRILVFIKCSPRMAQAVQAHQEYIMYETLTVQLTTGEAPAKAVTARFEFDREEVEVGLLKKSPYSLDAS